MVDRHVPQVGLVCSGGGARGFAHLGFLDRLAEAGLGPERFACVSGTSCGALILFLVGCGLDTKAAIELVRREVTSPWWLSCTAAGRLGHLRWLLRGAAEHKLRRHFPGARVESLWPRLLIVSFDVLRCRPYVHQCGDAVQAVLASMAVPGLARATIVGGRLLVDGGVGANLPARALRDVGGVGRVIGVDVTATLGRSPPGRRYGRFQNVLRILGAQQRRIHRQQRAVCDVLVEPRVSDVAMSDFSRKTFDRLVRAGREAADAALPSICELLDGPEPLVAASRDRRLDWKTQPTVAHCEAAAPC